MYLCSVAIPIRLKTVLMLKHYFISILFVLGACQAAEKPDDVAKNIEVLDVPRIRLLQKQNELEKTKQKQKPYLSLHQQSSGTMRAFEKEGKLIRLEDQNYTADGTILSQYYYLPSGELFLIRKTNTFKEKRQKAKFHVEQTELFFDKETLFKVVEKKAFFDSEKDINLEKMPEMELKLDAQILKSKSKRHNKESSQLIFFMYSEQTYDDFFDHQ